MLFLEYFWILTLNSEYVIDSWLKMTRGIQDERALVRILWKKGFAVLRAPASGASTKMPRPDILAGNKKKGLHFAIEVKTTRKKVLYIKRESIDQLIDFANIFGCQPIIALKFKNWKRAWIFIHPYHLLRTDNFNYKISFREALYNGMDLKSLIGEGKQTKIIL